MQVILKITLGASIALICCAGVFSAEVKTSRLSLDEVLSKALTANPEIIGAIASDHQAQAATREAKKGYLPTFSALAQYSTSDDIRTQLPDSNIAVVKVDYDLFQGGRIFSDINRLKNLEDSANAATAQKKLQIIYVVKASYYRGLSALEQITEWEQAQSEFEHLLKLIEPKFTIGSVPEYDYAKIRLSLSSYKQEVLKAEMALGHELYVLGAAMGSTPPQKLDPVEELSGPINVDVDSVLANALSYRPDLKSAEANMLAQESAVTFAKLERLPQIKVGADYGYSGFTARDLSLGWGFTATLGVPIFDFGLINTRVEQAEAKLTAENSKLEALRLQVRTEIYDTIQEAKVAWSGFTAAEQSLPSAKRAYASSLKRYRTGLAQMTELSDAHALLVQSEIGISQAKTEYRIALARLNLVRGLTGATVGSTP